MALIGAAGFNLAALAQQPKTASIDSDDLFLPDTADFKGDIGKGVALLINFVKQTQSTGSQCPTDVDFTVFDSSPDKLWAQTMAGVRRVAIEDVLRGFGPSFRITAKSTNGIISAVVISAQTARDKERPQLDTNSVPRKGTKVKAGDTIRVTMVARDQANLWQSGIKTIQLVAESDGARFVASENFPPAPPGCTALPPERRVVATYEVPANPPPIVRLAALAEDHAGLMDTDIGEFPTRDVWAGTVRLERDGRTGECSAIKSETKFTFEVADDGAVSGSGTLDHSGYTCPGGFSVSATSAKVTIGGKKQGGTFTLFLSDWPKTALLPRLPVGQWIVKVGEGSTGEGTFATFDGKPDVMFRVNLECRTCGSP